MSNNLLQTKEEVLGLFFLLKKIKKRLEKNFSISDEEACKEIEDQTEAIGRKVSNRSFRRVLNFKEDPYISLGKMNDLIYWYTSESYYSFQKYINDNTEELFSSNFLSEDELQLVLSKIQLHKLRSQEETQNLDGTAETERSEDSGGETLEPKKPHGNEGDTVSESNNPEGGSTDIKQINVLSAFNSSKAKKIKGKIRQINFLGLSNKQEVDEDDNQNTE